MGSAGCRLGRRRAEPGIRGWLRDPSFVTQGRAGLVLIDERRARRIAEQAYGLRVKGSAGILVSAKRAKLIPAVRPLLEGMCAQGYYLSPRLIDRAAGEVEE